LEGLDPTFGDGGRTTTSFSSATDIASNLALLPDGDLVVAGAVRILDSEFGRDYGIARYTREGNLATQFFNAPNGKLTFDSGVGERYSDMILLDDQRALMVGSRLGSNEPVLVWVSPDGQTVESLVAAHPQQTDYRYVHGIAKRQDGGLALLEWTRCGVVMYDATGVLDTSYGVGGLATLDIPAGCSCGPLLLEDGTIVIGGQRHDRFPREDLILARLTAAGAPDLSFGEEAGYTAVSFAEMTNDEDCHQLLLQPDGKILMLASDTMGEQAGLYRFTSDGSLDPSFGEGGLSRLGAATLGRGMVLDGNHLYVAGSTGVDADEILLARYRLTFAP
jgi:uncharacterized delta-60 repeat protein